MRLVAALATVAIGSLLLWMALTPRAGIDEAVNSKEPVDPISVATATDPYIRSIQGAQEARTLMERSDARIEKEL